MKRKSIYLLLLTQIFWLATTAQGLKKVTLKEDGQFGSFIFYLGESVIMQVSKDGQIAKWGVDIYESTGRNDNFQDKLEMYTGKTGYFTDLDDSSFRGKLKFIGRIYITWYASYESKFLQGKIKSIGNVPITYYDSFEDEAYRGSIKSIGTHNISWYRTIENEMFRGKLKSIASTQIRYYRSMDDKAFRGKIRSIGNAEYTYYSSFDRQGYNGSRKTGNQVVFENGIKFEIRY